MPRTPGAFLIVDGYDRSRNPRTIEVRNPRDVEEMHEWCEKHSHTLVRCNDGKARNVKINGRVRRWKRDPGRIEIPLKYGLYECATFNASDRERILIPVD